MFTLPQTKRDQLALQHMLVLRRQFPEKLTREGIKDLAGTAYQKADFDIDCEYENAFWAKADADNKAAQAASEEWYKDNPIDYSAAHQGGGVYDFMRRRGE